MTYTLHTQGTKMFRVREKTQIQIDKRGEDNEGQMRPIGWESTTAGSKVTDAGG